MTRIRQLIDDHGEHNESCISTIDSRETYEFLSRGRIIRCHRKREIVRILLSNRKSMGEENRRGGRRQRVYGKSHPTRESIDLNLLAFSSRGRAPLLSWALQFQGRDARWCPSRKFPEDFRRGSEIGRRRGRVEKRFERIGERRRKSRKSPGVESRMIANRRKKKKKKGERERKERGRRERRRKERRGLCGVGVRPRQ